MPSVKAGDRLQRQKKLLHAGACDRAAERLSVLRELPKK
jgi:hypothetical protein